MLPNTAPSLRSVPAGAAPAAAPAATAPLARMSLANVRSTRRKAPIRTLLYGVEGLGKSTFGASAESPIFLAAETGLNQIDAKALPEPRNWDEVLAGLDCLVREKHSYRTLVVDTCDWIEPMAWAVVCQKNKWANIDEPGFGKGPNAALDLWRIFVARLQRIHLEAEMDILLLAHARVKSFSDPAGKDYGRYTSSLNEKAYDVLKQWADVVLFGQFEDHAIEVKGKVKGVSSNQRLLRTQRCAAWDAKNRYGLAPTLAFGDYADYRAECERGLTADPDSIRAACDELLEKLPWATDSQERRLIDEHMAKPLTPLALIKVLNRLRVLVDEAEAAKVAPPADTE